jgi:hypothetical protein
MENSHIDLEMSAFKVIDLGKPCPLKAPEYIMDIPFTRLEVWSFKPM